jgi:hypothetical protein
MPSSSLYRRVSLWFNRRGSGSGPKGENQGTPSASPPSANKDNNGTPNNTNNAVSANNKSGSGKKEQSSLAQTCVLTRTTPSSYDNTEWISESVLLHEPRDMTTYTPHPTNPLPLAGKPTTSATSPPIVAPQSSAAINIPASTIKSVGSNEDASLAAASVSTFVTISAPSAPSTVPQPAVNPLTMSAPAGRRRLVRPRHFTFSDAHVSRSGEGRLARTTAFF